MEDPEEVSEQAEHDPSQEDAELVERELERVLARQTLSAGESRGSSLGLYFGLRNTYSVIRDPEVFRELFIRYQQAEGPLKQQLASEIVYRNFGLVVSLARFFRFRGVATEDLYQVGMIALFTKVLEKYDPDRGIRFSTYANWWIRHAMAREVADRRLDRPFRTPVHFQETISRVRRFSQSFEQKHSRPPTTDELAKHMGYSLSDTSELLQNMEVDKRPKSLHWQVGLDNTTQLIEVLRPEEEDSGLRGIELVYANIRAKKLKEQLYRLPIIQQKILHRRFALGTREETLKSIGDSFNLSRERVRQLEYTSLKTLAKWMQTTSEEITALLEYSNEIGLFAEEVPEAPPALLEINEEQAERIYAILVQHARQRPSEPYPRVISPAYTLTVRMEIPINQAHAILEDLCARHWIGEVDEEGHADLIRGLSTYQKPEPKPKPAPPPPPPPVTTPIPPPSPPPAKPTLTAEMSEGVIRLNSDRHEYFFEETWWSDIKALYARLRNINPHLKKKALEAWVLTHARSRLQTEDERGRKRTLYHREELREILTRQVLRNARL